MASSNGGRCRDDEIKTPDRGLYVCAKTGILVYLIEQEQKLLDAIKGDFFA